MTLCILINRCFPIFQEFDITTDGNASFSFMFENVYGRTDEQTDGSRIESHPVSSPCEPSEVSRRLR